MNFYRIFWSVWYGGGWCGGGGGGGGVGEVD